MIILNFWWLIQMEWMVLSTSEGDSFVQTENSNVLYQNVFLPEKVSLIWRSIGWRSSNCHTKISKDLFWYLSISFFLQDNYVFPWYISFCIKCLVFCSSTIVIQFCSKETDLQKYLIQFARSESTKVM